ncbi:killer cell lectin-like receptor 2 [Chionomys nivalis]|uniref:killer cell lectin-like receptor 2 n=1 Tax=Chionomys nivalis TaxID=269649 RepID=UPI00259248C2|nr:killer cell lectin-like receptor 2 [Chionomys nivalis]
MTDNEITYTTVRFHKSSELQNRARPDETQRSREAVHRESSTPWHFIVIPLGILCFILLVTVAVLVTLIFQCSQEKYDQNNLNQSTVQNTSASDKILTNKSSEYKGCKNQEEQNRCCGKTKAVLDYGKYTGKCAEARLFCCGIKCYYFIMDNKHWKACKKTCQDCSLSFLKIDDDDELKFLKYQFTTNSFWIGLSYEISKRKWGWIDNGSSKFDLMKLKLLKENGGCACLSFRGIQEDDCATKHPCICEKRMDIFPSSVYSLKRK